MLPAVGPVDPGDVRDAFLGALSAGAGPGGSFASPARSAVAFCTRRCSATTRWRTR